MVIVCILIYRVLHESLLWYAERQQDGENGVFSRQMAPIVEKVTMLFIIGGALMVVLKHFNYDILSLVTALGIGSLAIGMAAKRHPGPCHLRLYPDDPSTVQDRGPDSAG